MSKTAEFQYKCRLCGETYTNEMTNNKIAFQIIGHLLFDLSAPALSVGIMPKMLGIHAACKKGTGIADLIGYIEEEIN